MQIDLQEVIKIYKEALANSQEEVFLRIALQKQLEEEIANLKAQLEDKKESE